MRAKIILLFTLTVLPSYLVAESTLRESGTELKWKAGWLGTENTEVTASSVAGGTELKWKVDWLSTENTEVTASSVAGGTELMWLGTENTEDIMNWQEALNKASSYYSQNDDKYRADSVTDLLQALLNSNDFSFEEVGDIEIIEPQTVEFTSNK